ncbi:MAG: M14 family metallopeptidase [Acidimicrobiales bacterium]
MSTIDGLAPDYPTARRRFLDAVQAAGADVDHHPFPETGPDHEELATDVAWFGPDDARDVVVVVSGTHGVEGYAGSMCQSRWLASHGDDPRADGVALVFVHAFNPYGFAWVRRVNEDNVDLNRNFCDLAEPPANRGYDELADALAPAEWTEASQQASGDAILAYAVEHGMDAVQAVVSGGQYGHPDGLFYGGSVAARSQEVMREVLTTRVAGAKRVVLMDLHTGLGERGEVEIITEELPDSDGYERAVSWFGDRVASNHAGESVSAELNGEWMAAATAWLGPAEVTAVALEWGTVDSITVLQALRADNWLHNHGDPKGPDAPAIKADLRAAFAPDDPEWADTVYSCFEEAMANALTAVAKPA